MEILLQFLQVDCLPYAAVFMPYQGLGKSIGLEVVVYHLPSTHWYRLIITWKKSGWQRRRHRGDVLPRKTRGPRVHVPACRAVTVPDAVRPEEKLKLVFLAIIFGAILFFHSRARILLLADGGLRGRPTHWAPEPGSQRRLLFGVDQCRKLLGIFFASVQTVNTYKDFFHV